MRIRTAQHRMCRRVTLRSVTLRYVTSRSLPENTLVQNTKKNSLPENKNTNISIFHSSLPRSWNQFSLQHGAERRIYLDVLILIILVQ